MCVNVSGATNFPSSILNNPSVSHGYLFVFGYVKPERPSQIYIQNFPEQKLVMRSYIGDWTNWEEIDQAAIPSFYKNYSDLASLASALRVINLEAFPLNADMDSYRGLRFFQQSNSQVIATMTNLPPNVTGGEIQAIVLSQDGYGVQILFHSSAGKVYLRFEKGTGNFTSWGEWY